MADENTGIEQTQEEKDAASAAKFRAQATTESTTTEETGADEKPIRPDNVPEKFWDAEKGEVRVEELLKSYTEIEKAKGAKPEGEQNAPAPETAEALAEFTKLREDVTAQLVAGQAISDDQYASFEKRGLNRDDVDAFIAGQEALGQLAALKVKNEAGGDEAYKGMIEWARSAYTPAEIAAYDKDVHSNDEAVRLNAVRGLKARYATSNGRDGRSVTHNSGAGVTEGFKSKAEMVAAMRDPKYQKDATFRAEVARKVAGASANGVDLSR